MWSIKNNKKSEEPSPPIEKEDINGNIVTTIKIGDKSYSMEYDPEVGLKVPIIITDDEYVGAGMHHAIKYVFFMTVKRDMLIDIFKDILPDVLPTMEVNKNEQ